MAKLTPAMQNLLDAMRSGVRVHFMSAGRSYEAHYFRSDTMKPCTKQAEALMARGLAKHVTSNEYGRHSRLELI